MNMLPSDMKENYAALQLLGETMPAPTGRFEKRIARAVTIEVCPQNQPMLKERTLTENVSPHGARVLMSREGRPGEHVEVFFPKQRVWSRAQIVYCQRVEDNRFAVGLKLPVPLES